MHALTSASSKEIAKIKNHDGLNPKSLSKVLKDLSKTMVPSLVADKTKSEAAAASGHVPLKLVHPKMKAEAPKDLDKKSDPTDPFAGLWSAVDDSTSGDGESVMGGRSVKKEFKKKTKKSKSTANKGDDKKACKAKAKGKSKAKSKVGIVGNLDYRARQTQQGPFDLDPS